MADRVVSVKLQADFGEYTSTLVKAAAATKALGDSATQSSRAVGASADEAARKISDIRAQLVELGRTKVTGRADVDTIAARIQLAELQSELQRIDTSNPSARADAETAAAEAQLRTLQSELNRIDGRTVTANVNVDDRGSAMRATSQVNALWSAALALSPVLGSIGGAAAAGLGVVAPLAATAATGLGVLALGFSGVGDAVKLLDQRQQAVATTAAQSAASQVSSTRQIEAAQASLANAQANAAAAAISSQERVLAAEQGVSMARRDAAEGVAAAQQRASEAVASAIRQHESAERALGSAQGEVQRAQEDLARARRQAAEEMEDIQLRIRGGVIAERQAIHDLAEAQRELNEIPADASAAEREQLIINLERAKLRVDELKESNGDLTAEQAEWARTGVEGSQQVQDAQGRLAAAHQGVELAARAVGDAAAAVNQARIEGSEQVARAEREGAEKIAAAQVQVATAVREQSEQQRQSAATVEQAQRAVETAMQAVGTTGVGALAGIDEKLKQVNPSTLAFAGYLQDRVIPAFRGMQETAAAGLLPGVQRAFEELLPYLPRVEDFVGRLSGRFGELAVEGARALTSPMWMDFWRMIDQNADPIMTDFFNTLLNVGTGFAGISTAFMPMARDVSTGIVDLTGRFAEWGTQLSTSEGFRTFEAYIRDNWPRIREIIGNLAETIGTMIEAGAPIGSVYLEAFRLFTGVLAGLPVGVVQALLTAFLGFRAVTGIADLINGVASSFDRVQIAAGRIGGVLGDATGAMGRMSGAASGLLGVMGGPWGVALSGATILVGTFATKVSDAASQEDKWAQALLRGGEAADIARQQYQEYGDYGDHWLGRMSRRIDEWAGIAPSIDEAAQASRRLWEQMTPLEQAQFKVAESSDKLNRLLQDEKATTDQVRAAKEEYAYWTGEESRMQGELQAATEVSNDKLYAQGLTYQDLTAAASTQLGIYKTLLQERAQAESESAARTAAETGEASGAWQTHVSAVDVSLDEYARRLDEDTRNKENWRANIVDVTNRGGIEVGRILFDMGEEGARLAADLATATDDEFNRLKTSMIDNARAGGSGAATEMENFMKIMAEKGRVGGEQTAKGINDKLRIGVDEVSRIARQYGVNLAGGINPVLEGLGKQRIQFGQLPSGSTGFAYAEGGVVDYYAGGGLRENHVAQIAPGGSWRVWAEPETGGEAYIPLSPAKRPRSLEIWRETGRRLRAFADGGIDDAEQTIDQEWGTGGGWFPRLKRDRHATVFDAAPGWRVPAAVQAWRGVADFALSDGLGPNQIVAEAVHRPGAQWSGVSNGPEIGLNTASGFDAQERYLTAMHEVGHSLGLGHKSGRSIMNPYPGQKPSAPTAADIGDLRQIYPNRREPITAAPQVGTGGPNLPRPPSTAPFRLPISTVADAVMQKGYDEATAWLAANLPSNSPPAAGPGGAGPAGTGAVGGGWQSIWNFVKARIPQARINSTFRPGDPGYHGRGKAIDFGFGSGPGGAGSAGLASINRLLHDSVGRNLAELIYDGIGDDRPDLKNGRPLTYNAATRAAHRNHVHAAVYDQGGRLPSGTAALNLSGRTERVLNPRETTAYELGVRSRETGAGTGGVTVVVQAPPSPQPARTGPVMNVENQYINNGVELDLFLRQAEFRERMGAF